MNLSFPNANSRPALGLIWALASRRGICLVAGLGGGGGPEREVDN